MREKRVQTGYSYSPQPTATSQALGGTEIWSEYCREMKSPRATHSRGVVSKNSHSEEERKTLVLDTRAAEWQRSQGTSRYPTGARPSEGLPKASC